MEFTVRDAHFTKVAEEGASLGPPGGTCQDFPCAKEPYTKIVEELPQMRRETVHLVRQAVSEGRRAYVLVNNRAEGNAPLTVQALTDLDRASQGGKM